MVQVFQSGNLALVVVGDIFPVHIVGTAVEDGLLLGAYIARPHQLLEQREDEFGLLDQRVSLVPIGFVHIHGV